MTTENATTENTEITEKEPTQEELAQAEKDAEAGFAAGFAKVQGQGKDQASTEGDPDGKGEQEQTTQETSTTTSPGAAAAQAAATPAGEEKDKGAAAAAAAPAKDEWEGVPKVVRDRLEELGKLPAQMRNLAGNLGGLNSKLDSALATAKAAATDKGGAGAAPSDAQVQAALSDPKAWEKLKEDYPDWAGPVEAELKAIRSGMQALEKKAAPAAVDMKALKAEVKTEVRAELAFEAVEEQHPEWVKTVNTPEFAGWLKSQPAETQALASSSRARDAIKLLDGFKEYTTQASQAAADAAAARDRKQQRLESAVTPRGTSAPPSTGISDDQAFARGFNKVRKKG